MHEVPAPTAASDRRFEVCLVLATMALYLVSIDADHVGGTDDGGFVAGGLALSRGLLLQEIYHPPAVTGILSWVWRLWPDFPANLFWMKLALVTPAAFAPFLFYRLLVQRLGIDPWVARTAVVVGVLSPMAVQGHTQIMTEGLYAVVSAAGLLAAYRILERPSVAAFDVLAIGLPSWVRNNGLSLPLSLAVLVLARADLRPRYRQVLTAVALSVIPWLLFSLAHGTARDARWFGASEHDDRLEPVTPVELILRAADNVAQTAMRALPVDLVPALVGQQAAGMADRAGVPWLPSIAALLVDAAVIAGAVLHGCPPGPLVMYVLVSTAVILAWPFPPDRFLLPMVPLLAAFLLEGIRLAARVLSPSEVGALRVACGAGALFAMLALVHDARAARLNLTVGNPLGIEAELTYQEERLAYDWVRKHTTMEEPIGCFQSWQALLFTGRKALWTIHDSSLPRRGVRVVVLAIDAGSRDRAHIERPGREILGPMEPYASAYHLAWAGPTYRVAIYTLDADSPVWP